MPEHARAVKFPCPSCGEPFTVTRAGGMRHHVSDVRPTSGGWRQACPGVGREPARAPAGTVARDIETRGVDGYYFNTGSLGILGPVLRYRVQATETVGDRAGSSSSFPLVESEEEARRQLAELRANPAYARYDTWELVRMDATIRTSLVRLDPETSGSDA
jgi:predicted RNA-binding Zn-ribbon protein involved in translation (DUF1610 family)